MDGLECVFCQKCQTLQRTHVGGEIVKFLIEQLQPQDSASSSNKFGDIFGPESLSVDGSLLFPLCSECHSFYDRLCVIYKNVQELRSELRLLLGGMQGKIGVNKSQGRKSGSGSDHVGYRRFRGEIAQINLSESKSKGMFKSLINLQDGGDELPMVEVKEEVEIGVETGFESEDDYAEDGSVHFIIEPSVDDIQEQNSSSSDNTTEKTRKCKSRKRRRDSESDPDFSPNFPGTSPKKRIPPEHDDDQDEYEEVPPPDQSIPLVKPPDVKHTLWCEICGQTFAKSYQKYRHKTAIHFKKIYKCSVAGCISQFIRKDYLLKHTENGRHRYGEGDQKEIERRAKIYETLYGETDPNKSRPPPGVHIGLWCNICGQTFQRSYQKARHKQKVHEQKKYNCDQCKMVYNRSDGLYKHKQKAHRNKVKETSE